MLHSLSGRLRCKSVHSAFIAAVAASKAFGVGAAIIYGYLKGLVGGMIMHLG